MRRDLFEAGLNEAAGSLAASYGRWSFARSVERIRYSWRGGRGRQRRKGSKRDSREAWTIFAGFMGRHGRCRSGRRKFELGVMSCHTVALNVAAKDAAMNLRRPCGRRNKGRCRGA